MAPIKEYLKHKAKKDIKPGNLNLKKIKKPEEKVGAWK